MTQKKKTVKDETWDDVLIRSNFSDSGKIPTSGSASHSPDIIPWGTELIDNPAAYLTTDDNWGKDLGKSVYQNRGNFLYMRGFNMYDGKRDGRFYLYYAPCGVLQFPGIWKKNQMKTSSGSKYIKFSAPGKNTRVATDQPFSWIPETVEGHYCLIGRVWTKEHPNEIPDIYKISDFTAYILKNPNMAWRNVSMVSTDLPTHTVTVPYAQGNEAHDMDLGIEWEKVTPNKTWISFSCGTPLPDGEKWYMPKTKVTTENGKLVVPAVNVPAGWVSKVVYSVWFEDTPPKDYAINLYAQYPAGPSDKLYDQATPLEELGLPARFDKNGGPIKVIPVGGDSMKGVPDEKADPQFRKAAADIAGTKKVEAVMKLSDIFWKKTKKSIFKTTYTKSGIMIEDTPDPDKIPFELISVCHETSDADKPIFEFSVDYAQNDVKADLDFYMKWENIPAGCFVELTSNSSKFPVVIGKTKITVSSSKISATEYNVPANLKACFTVSLWSDDKTISDKASLSFMVQTEEEDLDQSPVKTRCLGEVKAKIN